MARGNNFEDVGVFHLKFGLPYILDDVRSPGVGPQEISDELMEYRTKFMQEELDEFVEASETMDHAKMADALIDLVYVAMGTAHMFGYPWQSLWDEVQRANMAKQRATSAEQSTRGTTFDVVKPEGWTPPRVESILRSVGFEL